jgi:hypothetical protein
MKQVRHITVDDSYDGGHDDDQNDDDDEDTLELKHREPR